MKSDILQPLSSDEGPVRYVDDREFVRLVLSRRKLERVGTPGHPGDRIRDVWTGEVYELAPPSGDPDVARRSSSLGSR